MSIFKLFDARNDLAREKPELNCNLKVITTLSKESVKAQQDGKLSLITANLLI